MEIVFAIAYNFVIKAVGFPFLGPKRDWDSFTESINLKTSASNSADDTGIVDDLNFDAELNGSKIEIRMGGGTEGISNN